MKRTFALALAALAVSSSAFAEDVDFHPYGFVSSVIRQAKADQQRVAQTDKSRAQVRAETREAARLGLLNTTEAAKTEPSVEQTHQIEQAGQQAAAVQAASK